MTYRVDIDESNFSPAEVVAWEIVLPYKHLHVLSQDESEARELTGKLRSFFTEAALIEAAAIIQGDHTR